MVLVNLDGVFDGESFRLLRQQVLSMLLFQSSRTLMAGYNTKYFFLQSVTFKIGLISNECGLVLKM